MAFTNDVLPLFSLLFSLGALIGAPAARAAARLAEATPSERQGRANANDDDGGNVVLDLARHGVVEAERHARNLDGPRARRQRTGGRP